MAFQNKQNINLKVDLEFDIFCSLPLSVVRCWYINIKEDSVKNEETLVQVSR